MVSLLLGALCLVPVRLVEAQRNSFAMISAMLFRPCCPFFTEDALPFLLHRALRCVCVVTINVDRPCLLFFSLTMRRHTFRHLSLRLRLQECYADRILYVEDGTFKKQAINTQQVRLGFFLFPLRFWNLLLRATKVPT